MRKHQQRRVHLVVGRKDTTTARGISNPDKKKSGPDSYRDHSFQNL